MVMLDTEASVRVSVSSPGDRDQLLRQSSVICLPDETGDTGGCTDRGTVLQSGRA